MTAIQNTCIHCRKTAGFSVLSLAEHTPNRANQEIMYTPFIEPEVQCYALRSNTGPYIQAGGPSPHPNPISFRYMKKKKKKKKKKKT